MSPEGLVLPQPQHRGRIAFCEVLDGPPQQQRLSRVGVVLGPASQCTDDGQASARGQASSRTGQLIAHTQIGFLSGHSAQGFSQGVGHRTGISREANRPLTDRSLWMIESSLGQGLIPPAAHVQGPKRLEGQLTLTLKKRLGQTGDQFSIPSIRQDAQRHLAGPSVRLF